MPIGGERIPQTMPTIYPEKVTNLNEYINDSEASIDYGEEYNKTVELRS